MKNSCELTPKVDGEDSKLFTDLKKKIKNRLLTKYIYAAYLQQGVAAKMTSLGKAVNKQGQHSAEDVYEFFNVTSMINSVGRLNDIEILIGAKNKEGNFIEYTSAKEALEISAEANRNNDGIVASVIQYKGNYRILVEPKDARTQVRAAEVEESLKLWQTLVQYMNDKGIDIEALSKEESLRTILNPLNTSNIIQYIKNIKNTNNRYLFKRDIALLLSLNSSLTGVRRLLSKFGDLDSTAEKIMASYRDPNVVTEAEKRLIETTLDLCKKLNHLDLDTLQKQIKDESTAFESSNIEMSIQETIKYLDKEYGLDAEEIHLTDDKITSLYHAASHALVTLQRQLDKLEKTEGITEEGKRLEQTIRQLSTELKSKHYYAGSLNFLKEALTQAKHIEDILLNIPEGLTGIDKARYYAKAINEADDIVSGYGFIVSALCNIDSISSEEDISETDKEALEKIAKEVMGIFTSRAREMWKLRRDTMIDIATAELGEETANGIAIVNIIAMSEADSSIYDTIYSIGRVSNPLLNLMGKIIRDAQDSRDAVMNDVKLRIRRAEHKLEQAGYSNDFMYDEEGYIHSKYDWSKFYKARAKEAHKLKKEGLKGLSLKEAIRDWEESNTDDLIVDEKSGRTERVPSALYYKDNPIMDNWSDAQWEYYDEMMQLKGELGSLLPSYAQKQFLPPQKRRTFVDAISAALHEKDAKGVVKAIMNKLKNIYTIREDDPDYQSSGIIDGEEYLLSSGDLDNSKLKRIPIFYINKLKEPEELMKDFSGALSALASTAINYDAMNNIRDTVEFMGDFIKNKDQYESINNERATEAIVDNGIVIFKDLIKISKNTKTTALVDGFLDQHMYGIKSKNQGKWDKLVRQMLAFNSIRALAVNPMGAVANHNNGIWQMLIEAGAGEFYGFKDFGWAMIHMFGEAITGTPGKVIDFFGHNKNNLDFLIAEWFDPIPGRFNKQGHERFHSNWFRQFISHDFTFSLYEVGEYLIHYIGMYAMLHHKKILLNGEETNMYKAFTKTESNDGNSELQIKEGATYLDGSPITLESVSPMRKEVRFANQSCHGAMNDEDKGYIHQFLLGKVVMNLRQWMVEFYRKRWGLEYVDASTNTKRRGFNIDWYREMYRFSKFMFSAERNDVNVIIKTSIFWNSLDITTKRNIRRAMTERVLLGSFWLLEMALGEPEDHKKDFWYRLWIYQTKRSLMELASAHPIGIAKGSLATIINSPIPMMSTIHGLTYPVTGLLEGDIFHKVSRGPYRHWNLYFKNLLKYTVPFYNHIDQVKNFDEDDTLFRVFSSSGLR